MAHKHLTGLIAAPPTAMHADWSLNLDMVEKQVEVLVGGKVSGAFVCGTTGEGPSLSVAERMSVAARWRAVAGESLPVIIHVGGPSLPDCMALAAHAQEIGAYAIAAIAPFFFKPRNNEELVAFCAEVAAAAPELPFYYYHVPIMSGVDLPVVDFLKLADKRMPTMTGVKFTYENLMDFGRCVQLGDGKFNMLFGRDEILLAGLALGADGAVGTTYNYAAPVYLRVIEAFEGGDMETARKEQARAMEMIAVLGKFGGLPATKAIMRLTGLDCGPVRLPLRDLSKQQQEALYAELDGLGFFDYCLHA